MIKISNLILPPGMIWSDKHKHSPVYQGSVVTLGGKTIMQSVAAVNGRHITLQATQTQGWLTASQVDSIIALANSSGMSYTFEYHGFFANVMFRHQDSPAVELEPFVDGEEPSDYHFGTIKLITL